MKSKKLNVGKNEEMGGERQGLKRFALKSARKLKGFTGNETLYPVRI